MNPFKGIGSMANAFNTGLRTGIGRGLPSSKGFGAMLTTGAIGATAGAAIGATVSKPVDPGTGAVIGGAVGTVALPAAGFAVGALGTVGVAGAKMGAMGVGALGSGLLAASPYIAGTAAVAGTRLGKAAFDFGSRIVDWDEDATGIDKVKFTNPVSGFKAGLRKGGEFKSFASGSSKASVVGHNMKTGMAKAGGAIKGALFNGYTILGGAEMIEGVSKAWNTLQTDRMGQMTGMQTMAPRTPSYSNNAGATGDLVFALNANRRG